MNNIYEWSVLHVKQSCWMRNRFFVVMLSVGIVWLLSIPNQMTYLNAERQIECRCSYGHRCFPTPASIQQGHGMCGICKNKTESRLLEWFQSHPKFSNVITQSRYDWCRNPTSGMLLSFDFEIIVDDVQVMIELDGPQHFRQVSNWGDTKSIIERDVYKARQALSNNYALIRISQEDVWNDRHGIEWKSELEQALLTIQSRQIWYISSDVTLYDRHHEMLV